MAEQFNEHRIVYKSKKINDIKMGKGTKNLFLCLFFSLCSLTVISQSYLEGYVKDSKTHEILSYVNIGIIGKNVGTVSNQKGGFKILLDDKYSNDSLRFSMLGYSSKTYKITDAIKKFTNPVVIDLEPRSVQLDEVVIQSRPFKKKILGNTTESKAVSAGFSSNELGNEVGIVIKIKNKPTYIEAFNVSIANNKYDTVKFRINFYTLKDGLPDKNILRQPIIVKTTLKTGILSVDLRKYNIVVDEDFFAALEWIEDLGKDGLYFSASLMGSPIIARYTSQGDWRKVGPVSLGFNVMVKY